MLRSAAHSRFLRTLPLLFMLCAVRVSAQGGTPCPMPSGDAERLPSQSNAHLPQDTLHATAVKNDTNARLAASPVPVERSGSSDEDAHRIMLYYPHSAAFVVPSGGSSEHQPASFQITTSLSLATSAEERIDTASGALRVEVDRRNEVVRVFYAMPRDGTGRIAVYDMAGAHMKTVCDDCPGGRGSLEFSTADLASGAYAVVLMSPRAKAMEKIMVVR